MVRVVVTVKEAIRWLYHCARLHMIALSVMSLVAAILLSGNLCGWSRYSVEDDGYVTVYGTPYPYKILRSEVVFPGWPPQTFPPVLSLDFVALLWDSIIGLTLFCGLVVLFFFRHSKLPPVPRRFRFLPLLLAIVVLVSLATWAVLAEIGTYSQQRVVLAQIKASGGCIRVEYPVPDVVWLAMRWVGQLWSSSEHTDEFLDASIGTVVFVQGSPMILSYVEQLPGVRALDVMDDPEAAQQYVPAHLSPETAPRLERIKVELGRITNLRSIIELPRLRFLTILGNPDPGTLGVVNRLTNLESLDLTECGIPEGETIEFDKLTKLRILAPGELTDAALRSIGKLPHLEELYLGGPTDKSIAALQDARSLRKLHLDGCWAISDDATKVLKRLTGLRYLTISGSSITDAGLRNLASLSELEELVLTGNRITSEGVSALAKLPHLRKLDISGTVSGSALDDRAGLALRRLTGLESLNLSGTKIADQGVADLRELHDLRVLDLSNTKVTDRCIAYLLDMKSLREVHLNMTGVTADGAARLQGLPQLQALKVYDCSAIPPPTLAKLQKQMPNVAIVEIVHDTVMPPPQLPDFNASTPKAGHAANQKK